MLGMAIGQSIRASRDAERAALASALSAVAFDPRETLIAAIQRELDRRSAPVVPIKGGALAERVRNNSLKDLPTEVDAILDVVGSVWGLHLLGVEVVYNTPVTLGDGFVDAAHGRMAVPAPAARTRCILARRDGSVERRR